MLDEWNLENYKDFLLIPVKSATSRRVNTEFYGFIILNPDLSVLFQDISEYKSTAKALGVAKQWISLHLVGMEAL